ncbi:transcriptional regulator, AraC family [Actinosynnema mirum DSM 43827]|uniref:Transcriptional regulator, AraC family n=1 Tax=Actinosynnema mirum (strain ATCC 29888 / DSM 43827 / JCM 3225 / NBRC 14064 / NCIMB 13271 / NRRL B-12336 / IMRU 3971 / 101) TaxID=446462 RepID=C6WJ98_ACTMD|nr:transcriptional regulator, AraC family [Actinosynnema mirum DSM 43827]
MGAHAPADRHTTTHPPATDRPPATTGRATRGGAPTADRAPIGSRIPTAGQPAAASRVPADASAPTTSRAATSHAGANAVAPAAGRTPVGRASADAGGPTAGRGAAGRVPAAAGAPAASHAAASRASAGAGAPAAGRAAPGPAPAEVGAPATGHTTAPRPRAPHPFADHPTAPPTTDLVDPTWGPRSDPVARALRMIVDGVVDREGVPGLATRLGYSVRQVERRLLAELGSGPLAIARARRARTARLLAETTALPMTEIAVAAGFASVRAFNETVRELFGRSPTDLRGGRRAPGGVPGAVVLRLPFRGPLHAPSLFGPLVANAVPGVEEWRDGAYRRTLRLPRGHGVVSLRPRADHVECDLTLTDSRDLPVAISRCRRALDLDADPAEVDGALRADPALRPLVDAAPGTRVPGVVDGAECAVRALLGEGTGTGAAMGAGANAGWAHRVVREAGEAVPDPAGGGLTHLFPTPQALLDLDPALLPPPARAPLTALLTALVGGVDLGAGADRAEARSALRCAGERVLDAVLTRSLGDPDGFCPDDPAVRAAAGGIGLPVTAAALADRSRAWRPWRAYATRYLLGRAPT